jgi:uncharacterized pyridoxamine 5'-phosphate oxidase family protein
MVKISHPGFCRHQSKQVVFKEVEHNEQIYFSGCKRKGVEYREKQNPGAVIYGKVHACSCLMLGLVLLLIYATDDKL